MSREEKAEYAKIRKKASDMIYNCSIVFTSHGRISEEHHDILEAFLNATTQRIRKLENKNKKLQKSLDLIGSRAVDMGDYYDVPLDDFEKAYYLLNTTSK